MARATGFFGDDERKLNMPPLGFGGGGSGGGGAGAGGGTRALNCATM